MLHEAAHELLDRLERHYRVVRIEGLAIEDDLIKHVPTETVVRLNPESEDAGSLTVAFTKFPGVTISADGLICTWGTNKTGWSRLAKGDPLLAHEGSYSSAPWRSRLR